MTFYDDEYEDDDNEIDYKATARDMNKLAEWLNDMPRDIDRFMRCGALAAAHARICAAEVNAGEEVAADDDDIDDVFPAEERDMFMMWLARLHDSLNRLRCIMNQTAIARFKLGAYTPALRKPTEAELEKITENMDEEEEDEDND
jgi:hypothetical protein